MSEIDKKWGLPKELFEGVAKEEQLITITAEKKRFGKMVTIIKGLDGREINVQDLTTKLKSKLACGGTVKQGEIILQGDHRKRVYELLVQWGFNRDNIEVE